MIRRRGFSLLEMVVVSGLFLGLLVGAYTILTRSTGYAAETDANSSAQQTAHTVMRRLVRELGNSVSLYDPSGVTWVRFLSAEPLDGQAGGVNFDGSTGHLVWRKYVCYWLDNASHDLLRAEIALDSATANLTTEPAPAPLVPAFEAVANKRVVARGVDDFRVTPASAESFNLLISVSAQAAVAKHSDAAKEHKVNIRTRVSVLNRFP